MTVATPTLSETYALLDKAIANIKSKKNILDNEQKKVEDQIEVVRKANDEYQKSIKTALELKNQLHSIIDESIPAQSSERIK